MTVSLPRTRAPSSATTGRVPKRSVTVRRTSAGVVPGPTPQPATATAPASRAASVTTSQAGRCGRPLMASSHHEHHARAPAVPPALDVAGAVGHAHVEHPAAARQARRQDVAPPTAGPDREKAPAAAPRRDEAPATPVVGPAAPARDAGQAQADVADGRRVARDRAREHARPATAREAPAIADGADRTARGATVDGRAGHAVAAGRDTDGRRGGADPGRVAGLSHGR